VLTATGIVGKYLCGYVAGGGLSVSAIGWGMVPRGELGLVFISVGRDIKVNGESFLNPEIQAGVLGAILLTTILGPIGLSWVLDRNKGSIK
jgi:Kef-type K+ transport system membrane component KefB